jgi:prepilin-type N-terminal cleavage/methylation domain-containing protein
MVRSFRSSGFAVIEVLVALLIVGIVAATAVLIVGGFNAKQVNHDCWNEAQRFQQLVRGYEHRHNGAVPGVKESRHSKPDIIQAALVMFKDDEQAGAITTFEHGDAPNQWQYDAQHGVVTPGLSCT